MSESDTEMAAPADIDNTNWHRSVDSIKSANGSMANRRKSKTGTERNGVPPVGRRPEVWRRPGFQSFLRRRSQPAVVRLPLVGSATGPSAELYNFRLDTGGLLMEDRARCAAVTA